MSLGERETQTDRQRLSRKMTEYPEVKFQQRGVLPDFHCTERS